MAITGINSENQNMRLLCEELYVGGVEFGAAQAANIADLTITATTGTLPTPNGAVTIADAASPTVAELQEAVVELNAKVSAIIAALEGAGIAAAS